MSIATSDKQQIRCVCVCVCVCVWSVALCHVPLCVCVCYRQAREATKELCLSDHTQTGRGPQQYHEDRSVFVHAKNVHRHVRQTTKEVCVCVCVCLCVVRRSLSCASLCVCLLPSGQGSNKGALLE